MESEGKQLLGIRCLMCQGLPETWEPPRTPPNPSTDPTGGLSPEPRLSQVRVF